MIDIMLSIITLKAKLRKFFCQYFIDNFDPNNYCSFHFLYPCHKCSKFPVILSLYLFCNTYSICTLNAGITFSPSVHLNIHFFLILYFMSLHCKA